MMDHVTEFQTLLEKFLSPDNDTRKTAEDAYDEIAKDHRASLLFLTSKGTQFPFEHRQLALVLLRRLFSNEWQELWTNFSPETQASFCNELLVSTQNEENETLRKRFCDLIAEVARNRLDDELNQTWHEVLTFMFNCARSEDPRIREIALLIIENVPGIFGRQQKQYIGVIQEMFAHSLVFTSPNLSEKAAFDVRVAAVKAVTAFICDNEEDQETLNQFQPLMGHVLSVCAKTVEENNDDNCLQCLVEIATSAPKLLRKHLTPLLTMCLHTVANADMDDNFRHSALEVVVSLAEANAPMLRKHCTKSMPDFMANLVQQCLLLMVDIEDDIDWAITDEENEEEDDSNATIGETSLDRLASALGGNVVLSPCLAAISPMVQHADWKYRYAGLMALSAIGEGCHKQMEKMLETIVDSIVRCLQDPHARVRYAACNALGQLSTDFGPTLQKRLHRKVIPALLSTLNDLENPRVAAHAGAALVNFSEDGPKSIVVEYLDPIMTQLLKVLEQTFKQLVEKGKKLVLEQIVTTIASVADSAGDKFAAYYDRIMPCLKYILQNATQPELRLLRGKTVECATLVGLAVGKEKFMSDASEVIHLLLQTQMEFGDQEGDDPQVSYMMSAWGRVCTILGDDFVQYLPLVMPAVMKVASFKPEVAVVECEDADHLQSGDSDWQFVNLGDQQSFGVKTAGLEDKASACQMLVTYARELKGGFADYVEQTTNLMVPLLKFYFHEAVRTAAAESLPFLLEAAKVKDTEFVYAMWRFSFGGLLKAIESEPEDDVLSEMLYSLAKCVECLGSGCLNDSDIKEIATVLDAHLAKHFEKASERDQLRKDEDYDEELENELVNEHDEDTFILAKVSDVLHAAFSTHKEAVLPHFDTLLPRLVKLLEPTRPYPDLQWAICMFDDVIEFCSPVSMKYQQYFLSPMIGALEHHAPEVRQAAAYGFGVMAMFGRNGYAQICAQVLPCLAKLIEAPDSRSSENNLAATENAIAAVSKILKYNNSLVDVAQVLPAFIGWLPTYEDKEEAPHIYGYLCDLIESNNPVAMGENGSHVPHLVAIIVEAFNLDALDDTSEAQLVGNRMRTILRHVKENESVLHSCLALLNDNQKLVFQKQLVANN